MRTVESRLADARRHEIVESRLSRDRRIDRWLAGEPVHRPPTYAELREAGYAVTRVTEVPAR